MQATAKNTICTVNSNNTDKVNGFLFIMYLCVCLPLETVTNKYIKRVPWYKVIEISVVAAPRATVPIYGNLRVTKIRSYSFIILKNFQILFIFNKISIFFLMNCYLHFLFFPRLTGHTKSENFFANNSGFCAAGWRVIPATHSLLLPIYLNDRCHGAILKR